MSLGSSDGAANSFEISVTTPNTGSITLEAQASNTTNNVKGQIQKETGIPPREQLLYFADKELGDGCTLSENNIRKGSEILLLLGIAGGGKRVPPTMIDD